MGNRNPQIAFKFGGSE